MRKITFQLAKDWSLLVETHEEEFKEFELFHDHLNHNIRIKDFLKTFLGDDEEIIYILADHFEEIHMRDLERDFNAHTPEVLTVFTSRRILIFRNIKNKNYYKSKNQIPGLERGYHLFDSCIMMKYNRVEHFYLEKNTLKINQCSANINEKSDRLKIDLTLYDFCYEKIIKIIGNYM